MRLWTLTFALLAALVVVSLSLGAASFGDDAGWLLMVSRIPRTAAALLAGAGLALAGVVVQQVVCLCRVDLPWALVCQLLRVCTAWVLHHQWATVEAVMVHLSQ